MATLAFVIASFLCGIAFSMGMLVGFRALQGFVAGPMYPITQALLISIYPPTKRAQALALLATVTVVAPIAGPILGGWITDNYSLAVDLLHQRADRHLFQFTVVAPDAPQAGRAAGKAAHGLRRPGHAGHRRRRAAARARQGQRRRLVQLETSSSPRRSSPRSALAVFLIWELTDKDPIVNLAVPASQLRAGTLTLMLAYSAASSRSACWCRSGCRRNLHYTAVWSGLASAPIGLLPVLLTPFVGKYAAKFDMRMLASTAFLVMGLASFARSGFNRRHRLRARGLGAAVPGRGHRASSSCRC
jgi:DHA2 family multidrug resistance protein